MYNIGICDDDSFFIEYMEDLIKNRSDINERELKFYQYKSGEALVDAFDYNIQFDLLILDMKLRNMDGDETAKAFREKYPDALLVFCSGVCAPTVKSFETGAFRYLLKQYNSERMTKELKPVLDEMIRRKETKRTVISFRNEVISADHSKILYAYKKKHGCGVFLYDKLNNKATEIKCNKALDELYDEMNDNSFAYPHTSYFVNLDYVEKLGKNEVYLADGTVLSVSKSRLNKFKESLIKYFSDIN